ncbi:LysM peptidoglycan-binding domain-containing protein [Rhodocytophaga aerolata]|uniref:LysM peptidoglycan-binding domain-containing protein n=2 Tax=Rhodocytophaga aerolata TaxID=455078 RepID=A0ABT8R682_9BACT|nr:LysM peptidoglycan-binding domain-containing protein [Rhodocytophaga aerolata]MDO1446262.1 LysM peptidoglycan-binding domain-containing protein [Rhodocytophaga aerolata]
MKLRIHESARRKIAADVEALTSNSKYFQLKVDRINMYFPLIEQILAEEGLPDDFKYLVVQESSLISDAVSTSNAVGYWQFKKESALEVGMVVDRDVDERKHIIAATRGAARYLKRNNFYLQNWIYTLQSYNNGLGGTQRSVNQRHIGAEKMDIDNNTHWYILKFLAHKIAFEDAIDKSADLPVTLLQYPDCEGKTLEEIAQETDVPLAELELYNKWLNRRRVPEDRDYIVILPTPTQQAEVLLAKLNVPRANLPVENVSEEEEEVIPVAYQAKLTAAFPELKAKKNRIRGSNKVILYAINGKPGIQAQPGDNSAKLAQKADIDRVKFLQYNDLKGNEALIPGEVYYLRKKKSRARVEEHIVTEGETLWKVSQMYGITMKALMRKNRMKRPEKLKHGRVLWLRDIRPASKPVEFRNIPKPATTIASKPVEKAPVKSEKIVSSKPSTATTVEKQPEKTTSPKAEQPSIATSPVSSTPPSSESTSPIETLTEIKADTVPIQQASTSPVQQAVDSLPDDRETTGEQTQVHTVTTGQTLYAIAKLYAITVAQLRLWNNLPETEGIKVGQALQVAPPSEPVQTSNDSADKFKEYTVQKGDSLYKIAKAHAVTVQELQEWNNKTDYNVAVGETLKIKQAK